MICAEQKIHIGEDSSFWVGDSHYMTCPISNDRCRKFCARCITIGETKYSDPYAVIINCGCEPVRYEVEDD